jgi:hypothetical protein
MPKNIAAAFDRANRNVMRFVTLLLNGGIEVGGEMYTGQDFVREWTQGGKKFLEDHWRDTANTATRTRLTQAAQDEFWEGQYEADDVTDACHQWAERWQGKHEWIPTNMLGYVVEQSLLHTGDVRWVFLAEVLRIPTRLVVVHPRKFRHPTTANPIGIHGHIGAVYVRDSAGAYKQQIKQQAIFHNALRELIRAHLSAARNDIDGYVRGLQDHITDWYWRGDIQGAADACGTTATAFASTPCPYFYNSDVATYSSWGPTLGDMARTLHEEWQTWTNQIDINRAAAGHLVPQPRVSASFPTAITAASGPPPFAPLSSGTVAHAHLMQDVSDAMDLC